ncbi:DUF4873 domain-containing protein [Antrihabitans sp. YC2-6]|uniref:DUF4873 domain-containing protein n=2 Tax=Nocardiaceae TaxID=85025 RepID=A0A934NX31_9NOCA|nr:DUF4873 domain-containing protein [Antrihabitans stalagmiti]MBJ8344446.1 DUF4873 domain-containing protein [Antrihabitans sp. YC2-6]
MADSHERSDYIGPGRLTIDGCDFDVEIELRGVFQPIDGLYRWYGRTRPAPQLCEVLRGRRAKARLKTPEGESVATVGDLDFWGRYRLEGTGRPPFHRRASVE